MVRIQATDDDVEQAIQSVDSDDQDVATDGGTDTAVEQDEDETNDFDRDAFEDVENGDRITVDYKGVNGGDQTVEGTVETASYDVVTEDSALGTIRFIPDEAPDSSFKQPDACRRLDVGFSDRDVLYADLEGRNGARWHRLNEKGTEAEISIEQ